MQITGGEPLLRKDLKTVLIEANRLNIYTGLNTNGLLLKDHKYILPLLHRLTISLDGPPEVHEKFRPAGTFDAAVEALAIAGDSGVDAAMQATVTSANAKYINYLVELSAKLKVRMIFEPASEYLLGEYSSNSTCGERKIIKNAMKKVESLKRDNPHISNQTLELRYLQVWPDSHNLRCLGSKIFFRVDSNGDVMVCGQSPMHYARDGMSRSKMPNILREGLTQALSGVPEPPCDTCYCCSRLQMNLIYSALFNPWKTLTGPPSR